MDGDLKVIAIFYEMATVHLVRFTAHYGVIKSEIACVSTQLMLFYAYVKLTQNKVLILSRSHDDIQFEKWLHEVSALSIKSVDEQPLLGTFQL